MVESWGRFPSFSSNICRAAAFFSSEAEPVFLRRSISALSRLRSASQCSCHSCLASERRISTCSRTAIAMRAGLLERSMASTTPACILAIWAFKLF